MPEKLVVIGAGAAGVFCAVNAARLNPSLEVVILEKSSKLLAKVKVSGGGRCNITHACNSIPEMVSRYPRGAAFLKKAFRHFFTSDTVTWFEQRGVQLKTETDGRMFPVTDNAQTVIDCLLKEAEKWNVNIVKHAVVTSVERDVNCWHIQTTTGTFLSDYVCVASGGLSGLPWISCLQALGHQIEKPVPSLFTFNIPGNNISELMGISCPHVAVKITGTKWQQEGAMLITHWGLSGPAILRLSAWAAKELALKNYEFTIVVNWMPKFNETSLLSRMQELRFSLASQKIINRNPFALPARLWEYFLKNAEIKEDTRWADMPAKSQNRLVKLLCSQELAVKGKTTFKEEFVTAGGISLQEIDADTMQSKLVPGLFFAGEVIDVDGITGGYNFQNAWTTGWIAANGIVQSSGLRNTAKE